MVADGIREQQMDNVILNGTSIGAAFNVENKNTKIRPSQRMSEKKEHQNRTVRLNLGPVAGSLALAALLAPKRLPIESPSNAC
jgi:hypothetical protein